MEFLVIHMIIMVTRKEKGTPTVVSMALRKPMTTQMQTQTSTMPTSRLDPRVLMFSLMYTRWSWLMTACTPSRSSTGLNSATIRSTPAPMSNELPSWVLMILMDTESLAVDGRDHERVSVGHARL